MANEKADSPKAFLIYETTFQQLKKYFTPAQAGEFLFLMGEYMLEGQTDVESKDPMVDMVLQMNKPVLDAAEKRHRQAVENVHCFFCSIFIDCLVNKFEVLHELLHELLLILAGNILDRVTNLVNNTKLYCRFRINAGNRIRETF